MEIRIDVNPGADIGAAIAAAIPSLRRSDGDYGGRIVLPRGQFFCSPVRVPPFNFGETRVVIEGEGGGTMLRPHPSTAAGEYLFHIGGRTEIKGIDFSNPDHRPVNAIRLFGVDQTSDNGPAFTEVTYCQFRQFGTAIRNENLGNWGIIRNRFLANEINIHSWNGGMVSEMHWNSFQGGRGIIFEHNGWASEGRNISNNQMVLMKSGIEIYNGLAYNISSNNIDADSGDCIILEPRIGALVDVKINSGWFSGFGPCGIRASGPVFRARVRDISIRGHARAGIALEHRDGWSPADFQFSGCNFEGNALDFFSDGAGGVSCTNHFGSQQTWSETATDRGFTGFVSRDDEFDRPPVAISARTRVRDARGTGAPPALTS